MLDGTMKIVNASQKIALPQADERFSFAGTSRQMKKSMTLCSLCLCGEKHKVLLCGLCASAVRTYQTLN